MGSSTEYVRSAPRRDGGAADAGAGVDSTCTQTPDEWLATCDGDEPRTCGRGHSRHDPRSRGRGHACDRGPSGAECRDLASSDERTREIAALRINVRVASRTIDFEELHFSHGYRRVSTPEALLDACDDDPSGADLAAIADANRAFSGCVDRGVLVPWVTTPVCPSIPIGRARGRDLRAVEGPEGGRCLAFDTGCTRGRYDASAGCCGIVGAAPGTVCGDGLVCDGGGMCVESARVPVASRTAQPFDWVAMFTSGVPEDGLIPIEVAVAVPVTTPPPGMPAGSLELWAPVDIDDVEPGLTVGDAPTEPTGPPTDPAAYLPDVLAIVAPDLASQSRVSVLRSAPTSGVQALAYDGPSGVRALLLPVPPGTIAVDVWAVRGKLDTLASVMSDGTSAGATRLTCRRPVTDRAAAIDVQCYLLEDRAVVVGLDVSLVWFPTDIVPIDFIGCPDGFLCGGDIVPLPEGAVPESRFCAPRACTITGPAGSCTGMQLCFDGQHGACLIGLGGGPGSSPEVCDGADNDCDMRVDEDAASSCNDGVNCTFDFCSFSGRTCRHEPRGALCPGAGLAPRCTIEVCTNELGVTNAADAAFRAGDLPPGPRAVGCATVAGHNWCTEVWDSCVCNGLEQCNPAAAGADGPTGCAPLPPSFPDPCDTDGNFCSIERACCEPSGDGYCRLASLVPNPPGADALNALCDVPGSSTGTWPSATPPGSPVAVRAQPLRCGPTLPIGVPRCIDFNPCTVDLCSPTTGCTVSRLPAGTREAESILGLVSGETCRGLDPFDGCSELRCGGAPFGNPLGTGSPGACGMDARTVRPAYSNTSICNEAETNRGCGVQVCDGTGLCRILQRPSIPPGGATDECGGERGSRVSCVREGCVASECVGGIADSDLCARPADCARRFECAPDAPTSGDPDVLFGCRPVGECYVGGGPGGGLDGTCYPAGRGPLNRPCVECDVDNPFTLAAIPPGTLCDDGNGCTPLSACDEVAECVGVTCDRTRPECDDEFCGAGR